MSHFFECCAEGGVFLAFGEEASDFGFGCQGDDNLHYVCNGVNGTVCRTCGGWRIGGFLGSVAKLVLAADVSANTPEAW